MALTAMDIHEKEFGRGVRGYRENEVDDFLDLCAAEVDRLNKEIKSLNEQLEQAKHTSGAAPAAVVTPSVTAVAAVTEVDNTEIVDVLTIAKKTADDLIHKARGQAQDLIVTAEGRASEIVVDAQRRKAEVLTSLHKLKDEETNYREKYRAMLEAALGAIRELPMNVDLEKEETTIMPKEVVTVEDVAAAAAGETVVAEAVVAEVDVKADVEPTAKEKTAPSAPVESDTAPDAADDAAPAKPSAPSFADQIELDDDTGIGDLS